MRMKIHISYILMKKITEEELQKIDKDFLNEVVSKSSCYLSSMVKENGQFEYGINPVNNFLCNIQYTPTYRYYLESVNAISDH